MNCHSVAGLLLPAIACFGCAAPPTRPPSVFEDEVRAGVEEIYIHRTVRAEHQRGATPACAVAPFPSMNEDLYELWSLETRASDSHVVDSHVERVGSFRACLGAFEAGRPLRMYTMTTLKGLTYTGLGECNPTQGQPPVRTALLLNCVADLSDLPPEYSGGVVVSSSLAPLTGRDQPVDAHVHGYLSTSVIVVRLWKKPKQGS